MSDRREYKYFEFWSRGANDNMGELDALLSEGWLPVRETPTGGSASEIRSVLVLLVRPGPVAS